MFDRSRAFGVSNLASAGKDIGRTDTGFSEIHTGARMNFSPTFPDISREATGALVSKDGDGGADFGA